MNRTAKSTKNVIYAVLIQGITTFLSFVVRTALMKTLGIQAVSLNGLFTEVIAMLSLTEMGVGTAIVYNLYKPLAENDQKKICQLMNLFKKAYLIIALATFLIGAVVAPWIQYLVNSLDYSVSYIRLVYMLFVLQTAATYLFSYKTALLNADQKKYIVSLVTVIVKAIGTVVLVLILILCHNFVLYLIGNVFMNIAINLVASIVVDRDYPYLKDEGELPKEEKKVVFSNVKNLFIRTLSGKITNSTDNILISALVNTLQVGFYSNYALFLNVMKQFAIQIIGGITGSLGNMMATESSEHCALTLKKLTFMFYSAGTVLCLGFYMCLPAVIEIWIGKEFLLPQSVLFICCYVNFLEFVSRPLWEIMTVSGLFAKDKNISIIGSTANLIISIVLGKKMGINGIFIGTICTYLIQIVLKIRLLYRERFHISFRDYYKMWLEMCLNTVLLLFLMTVIRNSIVIDNCYFAILVYGVIAVVIGILSIATVWRKTTEFKYTLRFIRNKIKV